MEKGEGLGNNVKLLVLPYYDRLINFICTLKKKYIRYLKTKI
jgi:hypothetical protein